jgi:agmatine/peptidylarginine deiminase
MKISIKNIGWMLVLLFSFNAIFSQENSFLPKQLTDYEKQTLSQFHFRSSYVTPPPTGAIRTAAEWEEVEYLVITWQNSYQNIQRQIVAASVNECKVIITTQNQTSVSNYLSSFGIDLTNVIFMNAPSNSLWIRDYAANTIYSDDVGQRSLVDWIYNRPRPLDNAMPSAHANLTGIPIYITNSGTNDLVNTGGNFMSDGLGTAFASELILEENASGNPYGVSVKNQTQIDQIMLSYMGIDNYIKMPTLPYDEIHHIDMHMKLLDEETLLVSKYPTGVADGPQIEANINYILSNFESAFSTPYKVKWIDAPPSTSGSYPDTGGLYRTYSNSVIINKTILVPVYRPEVDAVAIARYQELMPGYTIVGIDVDNPGENLIASLGAIHCITHTIGVADPLLIVHQPIKEAISGSSIIINASIKHISGIQSASVFWRIAGTTAFNETPMTFSSDTNWSASITIPISGLDIEYYIHAQAISGKSLNRPIVAPEGFWTINVETLAISDWASKYISNPYPNPANEKVSIDLNQLSGRINVRITNILGQTLYSKIVQNDKRVLTLDLEPNWKGTLFITLEGDFGKVVKKVMKK